MRAHFALLTLVGAYFALAILFALETPYRVGGYLAMQKGADGRPAQIQDIGAPDERQHANYVSHLLEGKGFPVLNPADPNLYENYQAHQPPLYYLLAAGWEKVVGLNPVDPESGFRLRFFNIVIGAATIFGVYLGALWGLGRKDLALGAAAIAGLMPMFIALNSAVTNDCLLICLCSWCLALTIRASVQKWTLAGAAWIGVIAGLAILTKTTGVALLPMVVVALWVSRRELTDKRIWLIALGLPILIALPWWLRNQSLYGDPLAMGVFKASFGGSAQREDLVAMIQGAGTQNELSPAAAQMTYWTQWFGWWTARSYVGVFGYMDIFLPNWVYGVIFSILALLGIGSILSFGKLEKESVFKRTYAICATFLIIVALLYLQFNLTYFQAQARYLYPAVAATSILLAAGIGHWGKGKVKPCTCWVAILLLATDVYCLLILNGAFQIRMMQ